MTLFTDKNFEDFWKLYDKKIGKVNTQKEWKKLKPLEIERVFQHVPFYLKTREKQYRKDPERYLKHKVFMDEIETEVKKMDAMKIHEKTKQVEKEEPLWNPSEDEDWKKGMKQLAKKWSMNELRNIEQEIK